LPEGHGSLFLKRSDGNGSQFGGLANGFHISGRSIYHGGLMIAGVGEIGYCAALPDMPVMDGEISTEFVVCFD
jgi:hypothetical protein